MKMKKHRQIAVFYVVPPWILEIRVLETLATSDWRVDSDAHAQRRGGNLCANRRLTTLYSLRSTSYWVLFFTRLYHNRLLQSHHTQLVAIDIQLQHFIEGTHNQADCLGLLVGRSSAEGGRVITRPGITGVSSRVCDIGEGIYRVLYTSLLHQIRLPYLHTMSHNPRPSHSCCQW